MVTRDWRVLGNSIVRNANLNRDATAVAEPSQTIAPPRHRRGKPLTCFLSWEAFLVAGSRRWLALRVESAPRQRRMINTGVLWPSGSASSDEHGRTIVLALTTLYFEPARVPDWRLLDYLTLGHSYTVRKECYDPPPEQACDAR